MENEQEQEIQHEEPAATDTNKIANIMDKLKSNSKIVAVVIVLVVLGVVLFFSKSLFVVATVNGSPISRLSVIRELELQGGAQALNAIITQKLIADAAIEQGIDVSSSELDEEIKTIEDQLVAQGTTLEDALAAQGISRNTLLGQLELQKRLEKLLENKIVVTEADINTFITQNNITIPVDQTDEARAQITDQLKEQKLSNEASIFVTSLLDGANINYYINY